MSRFITKFSELTSQELYDRQQGELSMRSWGERVTQLIYQSQ